MFSTVLAFLVTACLFLVCIAAGTGVFLLAWLLVEEAFAFLYHVLWHAALKLQRKGQKRRALEKSVAKASEGFYLMNAEEISQFMQKKSKKSKGAVWKVSQFRTKAYFEYNKKDKAPGWGFEVHLYGKNFEHSVKEMYGFKTLKEAVQACKDYGYVAKNAKPELEKGIIHELGEHICIYGERGYHSRSIYIKMYYKHKLSYQFQKKQLWDKKFKTHLEAVEFLVDFIEKYSFLQLEDWAYSQPKNLSLSASDNLFE